MSRYPALDFLREVGVWQDDETGTTAGLAVALRDDDRSELHRILGQALQGGPTTLLDAQARYWLIGYRQMNPPLTPDQETRLALAIGGPDAQRDVPYVRNIRSPRRTRRIRAAVIGAVAVRVPVTTGR